MNKQASINAINNGATLHINKNTGKAHVCCGTNSSACHPIRLSTAEQLEEVLTFHSSCGGVRVYGA